MTEALVVITVLQSGRFKLVLRPHIGGSIARFDWIDGRPILHPLDDVHQPGVEGGGCFPLVPFSNRLRDGAFVFEDLALALSPNVPGTGRVVHGFGWRARWEVIELSDSSITMEHLHDGREGWPWPYRAIQRYALDRVGLCVDLALTNLGDRRMPAGLGFHPYFPLHADTTLKLRASACAGVGHDGFPEPLADEVAVLGHLAFGLQPIQSLYLSGVTECISVGTGKPVVGISCSRGLSEVIVYAPPERGFICVEPTSHRVGALNQTGLAAQSAAGIMTLEPGESQKAWMRLTPANGGAT